MLYTRKRTYNSIFAFCSFHTLLLLSRGCARRRVKHERKIFSRVVSYVSKYIFSSSLVSLSLSPSLSHSPSFYRTIHLPQNVYRYTNLHHILVCLYMKIHHEKPGTYLTKSLPGHGDYLLHQGINILKLRTSTPVYCIS